MPDKTILLKAKKEWQKSLKDSEYEWIRYFTRRKDLSLGYDLAEHKAWIYRTLRDQKSLHTFSICKKLVLVGSGYYPYSMFDIHRQYPKIKQIGIDYDKNAVKVSTALIKAAKIENDIKIICSAGEEFDYTKLKLDHEDLIFLSSDIKNVENIYQRAVETSKAGVYVCSPYKNAWLKSIYDKHGYGKTVNHDNFSRKTNEKKQNLLSWDDIIMDKKKPSTYE